jgi:MFS family permease
MGGHHRGGSVRARPGRRDSFWLRVLGLALVLSGLVALVLGWTGRFLPHDERFLGMTAAELCAHQGCRIVHFMAHDRIAFGGAVAATGLLYLWLARQGRAWAWWALLLSGAVGFASFLAYLGYGYLDTWHGLATLGLLPCFLLGLARSPARPVRPAGLHGLFRPSGWWPWRSAAGMGRACLLLTAIGLVCGGLTILAVGMTCVFVPQDLAYLGLGVEEMRSLNPRLVPLIAHDRAGFGGAVCCLGVALFFCVWCGTPSPRLWRVLALVGVVAFGAAIGAHPAVGYNDAVHLAPAVLGAFVYLTGLVFTFRPMVFGSPPTVPVVGGLPQEEQR